MEDSDLSLTVCVCEVGPGSAKMVAYVSKSVARNTREDVKNSLCT